MINELPYNEIMNIMLQLFFFFNSSARNWNLYSLIRWLLYHAIRCARKSKSKHILCHGGSIIIWKAECQQIWTEVEYFVTNNIRIYYIKLSIHFDFWTFQRCEIVRNVRSNPAQNKTKTKAFAFFFLHISASVEGTLEQFVSHQVMLMISRLCWV